MNNTILEVKNLTKSFKDKKVLKGVNFHIKKGSIFALLGSNGAGKTTTIRILSTLTKADGGSATVCGHDINKDPNKVRGSISLTGQFAAVDEVLTGRENIVLIAKLRRVKNPKETAAELLKAFSLEEAADKAAVTYSGGMRRRLDIAMSLVGNPEIIFLDEPTTGLDPQNRIAMWNMVRDLANRGTTILLTTQYLEEAEYLADYISILHEGKIAVEGTADELKTMLPRGMVELVFPSKEARTKAEQLLSNYKYVQKNGKTLVVTTNGTTTQFADVLNTINNAGVSVETFTQKVPSLEEVFLSIVGGNK